MDILPYSRQFNRSGFDCGKTSLNNYILRIVTKDVKSEACTCFVITDSNKRVIGYYTLSTDNIQKEIAPETIQKKINYPYIPVILLGRLAVDKKERGKGFGKFLLVDALKRSLKVAKNQIGAVAFIVDPIDEYAIEFYAKYGFTILPTSQRMFMTIRKVESAFNESCNSGKI